MTLETSGQFTSLDMDLDKAIAMIEAAFDVELNKLQSPQRERLAEIIDLTDKVWANSHGQLERPYRTYCRMLASECFGLFPSFPYGYKTKTWAAAILWSVVMMNRHSELSPSSEPRASDVAAAFGVSLRMLLDKSQMISKRIMRARVEQFKQKHCSAA